jgi:hypothetical protein
MACRDPVTCSPIVTSSSRKAVMRRRAPGATRLFQVVGEGSSQLRPDARRAKAADRTSRFGMARDEDAVQMTRTVR